ncbi:two-component system histidine kinase PnpS [Pelosinus sp. IPA-1]|uniref:two-component system histidine kinase PnpS n=1 Tax=Pelosinus sp. IPA-1 TaxID=3029569 RepID=UPI0024362B14|nr:ATP-binding protein [Pelosinus sp. IPA-1]GMA97463.1 PAS domain-containing sensor histidine kinase [Pelosinus sp. IPA-1]
MLRWGIKLRLIVNYLILIIVTMSCLSGYLLWYFHRHNIEILTSSLLTHARVTEHFLENYMIGPTEKANIDNQIKELATKDDLRITVTNINGDVLADSWENPATMENHLHRPEISAALAGTVGTSIRYSTTLDQNMLYVANPILSGSEIVGAVRISSTLAAVEAGFNQIKSTLLVTMLLTSFLAILLSIRLAQKYTAPLEEITRAAQEMANGNLDRRLHIRTGDELELLAPTLNNLTSNLDDKISESTAETKKLDLILQHMDNAVILLDRYGRVTTANKMARESFDISDSMLHQHNMQVFGHSQLDRAVHQTLDQGKNMHIYLKTNIKNTPRVFQVFFAPITTTENEITAVLSVFHDVTALQDIHDRQADFVANASHELATPLTTIKGFTETLLDGAIEDPQLSTKFLNIIHTESERMQRLIHELLQLAKLNSQEYRQQVTLEATPLNPLLYTTKEDLSSNAQEKNITVDIHTTADPIIMANPDWLKQILINLLDNSIKYTQPFGRVVLTCFQENDEAILTIEDTGIGIPAKDLPLIFDRFYRVDRARSRGAGGTGLGLAIVKFIVEMHGGRIDVKSTVNIGTTFTITLPLA